MTNSRSSFYGCLAVIFLMVSQSGVADEDGKAIPSCGETVPAWHYTIKPGDTLISIAGRYLARAGEYQKIQKNNRIADPYRILPGTVVHIPVSMLRKEPGVARLKRINGNVRWHDGDGAWRAAVEGLPLAVGATVETPDDASALLVLADDSRIVIAPDSVLVLDMLSVYAGGLMADTCFHLPRGQVDIVANPRGSSQQNMRIRTPSAQAVVRGTRFRIEADAEVSHVETLSGLVGVAATGERVAVPAGKGTTVRFDKPPTSPTALLPAADVSGLTAYFEALPMRFDLPQLPGAVEWQGLIAPDREFQSILSSKRTHFNHLTFSDLPDGDYVLALRAIDDNGLQGRDALHDFTVFARPFPPGLNAPGEGAIMRTARPRFVWGDMLNAARYRFQVSTDAGFVSLLHDAVVTAESTEIGEDLPPGPLFWRVATITNEGRQGPWSQPVAFLYKLDPKPTDLGRAVLRVDHERLVLNLPPPVNGMYYEAELASDENMQQMLVHAQSDDGVLGLASPGVGTFYLGVRLVDLSDGTPGPLSVQKVDIPAGDWVWLLLLPLFLLI
jgi:hypothetical protein